MTVLYLLEYTVKCKAHSLLMKHKESGLLIVTVSICSASEFIFPHAHFNILNSKQCPDISCETGNLSPHSTHRNAMLRVIIPSD